jgi:hypothetical protein
VTLRERIAEWESFASKPSVTCREVIDAAKAATKDCLVDIWPIAEALEAVVRDAVCSDNSDGYGGARHYPEKCVRCRLERIVGSK